MPVAATNSASECGPASKVLKMAKDGSIDTLLVHSIDRLGRNTLDILQTIQEFTHLGVNVKSEKEGLETLIDGKENPIAKLMINIMATLSELISENSKLSNDEAEHLAQLVAEWRLLADLSFADLVLWLPIRKDEKSWPDGYIAIAQIRPTTAATVFSNDLIGSTIDWGIRPKIDQALSEGEIVRDTAPELVGEIMIKEESIPVIFEGKTLAVISRHRNADLMRLPSKLELNYREIAHKIFRMVTEGSFPIRNSIYNSESTPRVGDGLIKVQAGENWHEFVLWSLNNGYNGIENLSLIPGNVGAAPMQNIGAYGVELKDTFVELEAFHTGSKEIHVFSNSLCEFGYRESVFKGKHKGKYIILSVTFKLKVDGEVDTKYGAIGQQLKAKDISDPSAKDVSDAVITIRKSKLPDPSLIGNSGSFFKNPIIPKEQYEKAHALHPEMPHYVVSETEVKVPAGWLIEKTGFTGIAISQKS